MDSGVTLVNVDDVKEFVASYGNIEIGVEQFRVLEVSATNYKPKDSTKKAYWLLVEEV